MKKVIQNIVFIVSLLCIWWLVSKIVNKSLFLPSPVATFEVILEMTKNGTIWKHLGSSFKRVTIGICAAAIVATPVGMLISWNKTVNKLLNPVVSSLRYVPVTCFSPMLVLLFGIDEQMKIIFIFIAGFFSYLPTVIQTASDPSETNEKLKETAYTMGFSYPRMLWYGLIPYITPSLLQSFISLYAVGWTYVIIAEVNNATYGLGHLMYIGSARGRTATVFAAIVVIVAVSYIFDKVATTIIRHVFKWRFIEDEAE